MTYDDKMLICKMRLDGANISSIAEKLGCSYQTVCNFLQKLPKVDRPIRTHPNRSNKYLMAICADYLNGISTGALAQLYQIPESEILEIFSYIAEKKPISVRNTQYPAVTDWMNLNGYTTKTFAALLGISANKFIRIINGKAHMLYETADDIRRITGLSFQEIFSKIRHQPEMPPKEPQLTPPGKD